MIDDLRTATVERIARRPAGAGESARASRLWWERAADEYQAEHGDFLGDAEFVWGPEGLTEREARLLGSPAQLAGRRVLEIGCGAGQCGRWLRTQGVAEVVGIDVSARQLQHSRRIDEEVGCALPVVQADAQRLPFADAAFDVVCSAYGAFPFIPDARAALAEAARVLRPGGRLVFSVSHPIRWCFPDDPGEEGLRARDSYFDRRAYVEEDGQGRALYVEAHHTIGDWVRAVTGAGLLLRDLVEPEWPEDNTRTWGGWSPLRGRILPGTAIFVADRP
ncbi:class I SAM-dependent methyltransferase [Thermobifida cellulosilytica]|uniref:SAM-dependent methyltransferase n=1 Tax=Thermobifida cellulosilytica TB100 TaxID=665004 RepID=A0A147KGP8_THECS|nr:class I SAM-dependent methyltransferase [Thermobifida cellulosilytica]KUP96438.1 SAM-dependent methyltransferase [Thermobifida cellulosilytica TB100]